ncbi:effector-associated constant component EACC1 [Spirillospora sp. CA-294931]|uniref:effector-associated constant component EACC1 n=1 Tax=Spirillospora sp. CA-294931 TaxID=3240042 RepID=UPI003D8D59D0
MDREQLEWCLRPLAGGDTLRQERLTRDLRDHLLESDELTVRLGAEPSTPAPGHKGGLTGELALWVTLATTGGTVTSKVLITLIREWSLRERQRKVEINVKGDTITLTGRPDESQERLVREFIDRVDRERGAG